MRLHTLLLIAGLLALIFGLGLLPGLAVYLVRDVRDAAAQGAGPWGSGRIRVAGLAVALMGQRSGLVNALGWSTVAIYGLLPLGLRELLADAGPRGAGSPNTMRPRCEVTAIRW
jgi:hypothetical protein